MDKENYSRSNHVKEDYNNGQIGNTGGNNTREQEIIQALEKNNRLLWDHVYGRKDIHSE